MKRLLSIICVALFFGGASLASAATHDLVADIDGAQAGTTSTATGFATMTYDDVSGLFSWDISWGPLEGDITVAHFHGPAMPGMGAGVQVNFGSISGLTSPSIGSTIIDAQQGADLLAGLWYINIHSTFDLGGEIRGQVELIPIPAAVWMLLSALGALGFWRRR